VPNPLHRPMRPGSRRPAFTALVDRHEAMVWSVCRRVLGGAHESEDAFQVTSLPLVRAEFDLDPVQFKEFRVQTRMYESVEIPGIALEPNEDG
jgi:hypothetical protein